MATASIVTIGNELVSGDTVRCDHATLARRVAARAGYPRDVAREIVNVRDSAGAAL